MSIRELLKRNTEETEGIIRALNGEYILPEAGGDLLRDGAGVLPTGNLPLLDNLNQVRDTDYCCQPCYTQDQCSAIFLYYRGKAAGQYCMPAAGKATFYGRLNVRG